MILKDLVKEVSNLNPEAVRYISFVTGLIDELDIYEDVLENLIGNMTEEEKEIFLDFEKNMTDWTSGKEVKRDE
jgi:hypothetical protein